MVNFLYTVLALYLIYLLAVLVGKIVIYTIIGFIKVVVFLYRLIRPKPHNLNLDPISEEDWENLRLLSQFNISRTRP